MRRRDVEEWFWLPGEAMQRLAQEMGGPRTRVASGRAWEPRVDLIEEDGRFLIKAEIAGVHAEHIQILYLADRHSVLLRGYREEDDFSDGSRTGIHQLEIFYGEFQREVALPAVEIVPDQIRASTRNGLLIVQVPKRGRYVVTHRVTIREV